MLFILLISSFAYAADRSLHVWLPLVNYSNGLCDDEADNISGQWGFGLLGIHYRFSPELAVTAAGYKLSDYADNGITYSPALVFDLVAKYRPALFKAHLSSKRFHTYAQGGLWIAHVAPLDSSKTTLSQVCDPLILKGSGCVVGIGGQYDLSSRFFVDISGKWLWAAPLFHYDVQSTGLVSLGFGVRLG
jgi:hypothetical protein